MEQLFKDTSFCFLQHVLLAIMVQTVTTFAVPSVNLLGNVTLSLGIVWGVALVDGQGISAHSVICLCRFFYLLR